MRVSPRWAPLVIKSAEIGVYLSLLSAFAFGIGSIAVGCWLVLTP